MSVIRLVNCAAEHVKDYCATTSKYAWPTYDIDEYPHILMPTDVLATAFLNYRIKPKYLQEMFQTSEPEQTSNEYHQLLGGLKRVVEDESTRDIGFEELLPSQLTDQSSSGWGLVIEAINLAQGCSGLTSVFVTKVLHRKRPRLIPIHDSKVRQFYGITNHSYENLFRVIHSDVVDYGDFLDDLRKNYTLPSDTKMSRLRALDIAVWMHMYSGCSSGT